MKTEEAITACHGWMLAHPEALTGMLAELYRRQTELDIAYQDRPIDTFLRPCFLSRAQRDLVRGSSEVLLACAERLIRAALEDASIRGALSLLPEEDEFARLDSGLLRQVVIARPDSFLSGDELKYLEFNSDSPAGVAWTDLHEQVFLDLDVLSSQTWADDLGTSRCRRTLLDAFRAAAREFGLRERPVCAVIDWREVATGREFVVVARYLEEHGIETVVADPRELELRGETLYAGGTAVNLVYRRAIIREVHQRREEPGVRDFLEAYRRKLVCVVNPFSAKLSGSKAFMALLSDRRYDSLFTAEQNRVRRQFIPWTRVLRDGRVEHEGEEHDVFSLARRTRERMVIKPTNGYGGKGVAIGPETCPAAWDDLIERSAREQGEWTMQEYVPIPEEPFPVLEPALHFESRKVNLNPYLFGGVYAGSFVRLSRSSVINVSAGGGMVPAFVLP